MNIEPFGDLSIDIFEELQELDRPVTRRQTALFLGL
jgi:hypothetical protein